MSEEDMALSVASSDILEAADKQRIIMMGVGGQTFGTPVELIEDVLRSLDVTPIPLAPSEVAGALNLRGRIVTVIDLRKKLALQGEESTSEAAVVFSYDGELYGLRVDKVAEVVSVPLQEIKPVPENLPDEWASMASGVYPTKDGLVVILSPDRLLGLHEIEGE